MKKILSILTFLLLFQLNSYSFDLGDLNVLEDVLEELEEGLEGFGNEMGDTDSSVEENIKKTEQEIQETTQPSEQVSESSGQVSEDEFKSKVNFPVVLNLVGEEEWDDCGLPREKYIFKENNEVENHYFCPDSLQEVKWIGSWEKIYTNSDEPFSRAKVAFATTNEPDPTMNAYNIFDIYWGGVNAINNDVGINYQPSQDNWTMFDYADEDIVEFIASTKEQKNRTVDKSLGGYKGIYFDMSLAQVEDAAKEICPGHEMGKNWITEAPTLYNCLKFRGEIRDIEVPTNDAGTIDSIIIKGVDFSQSYELATYFFNESGIAVYDEIVETFKGSEKYEFIRYPTEEEKSNFNSMDDNKIYYTGAYINTVFKNKETNNYVALNMQRLKFASSYTYGHNFDIIYLSPGATARFIENESSKVVSDDDI